VRAFRALTSSSMNTDCAAIALNSRSVHAPSLCTKRKERGTYLPCHMRRQLQGSTHLMYVVKTFKLGV
jgi:hypothetical protein